MLKPLQFLPADFRHRKVRTGFEFPRFRSAGSFWRVTPRTQAPVTLRTWLLDTAAVLAVAGAAVLAMILI